MCKNHKCIPGQLQCDGFDHCGDNSDEPESCKDGKVLLKKSHASVILFNFRMGE